MPCQRAATFAPIAAMRVLTLATIVGLTSLRLAAGEWSVDLNARTRFESRSHTLTFDDKMASLADDSWLLTRVRIGAKGEFSPQWKSYFQLQDSRELGSHRPSVPFVVGSEGDDPLDLRQAYFDFSTSDFVLRVGRQVLSFGDERLVGPSDWTNFARTFDAVRVSWPKAGGGVEVFVSSVVQAQPGGVTGWHANHSSHHDLFAGVYGRFDPNAKWVVEPYVLLRRSDKDIVYSAGAAGSARPYDIPQKIITGGLRLVSAPPPKPGGFDFDADVAGQTGEARGRQLVGGSFVSPGPAWLAHRAWALHGGIGYSASMGDLPFRLYAEANRASGDRNPADTVSGTFLNLFPGNHKFYGLMDVFSWKNMREIAVSASTTVAGAKARIEQHWFALDTVNDTWFRPLTPAARGAPRRAGNETDFVVSRSFGRHVTLEGGFNYFAAGPYLRATGGSTDARFGYVQCTFQW